jgi:hypothetical protein
MGTPTPTPRKTPTPAPNPTPTRKVRLPAGILGRTMTKGEILTGLKPLVEASIPSYAKNAPREVQVQLAVKVISSLVHLRKTIEKAHGLTDVQAAKYLVALAKWNKPTTPPGFPKGPKPKPEQFRSK